MGFFRKLIDSEYKELKRFESIADKIIALDESMQKLFDYDLNINTEEFIIAFLYWDYLNSLFITDLAFFCEL